jgi:hypothetical protein
MRKSFLVAAMFATSLLMAQSIGFESQQRTSGVVGITPGQTARLNVLYPTVPAPILQVQCSATLAIADDQGQILKSNNFPQLLGGKSVSIELNADSDLPASPRTEIHGLSISPNGCNFVVTLEIIDNATQRTLSVVGSEPTYLPPSRVATQPARAAKI